MNTPRLHEGMVSMPKEEFEELLELAAQRGARHAPRTWPDGPGQPTTFANCADCSMPSTMPRKPPA